MSAMSLLLVIYLAIGLLIPISMERLGRFFRSPGTDDRQSRTVYESGVEALGDTWQAQSLRYYRYALLFVLFDAETAFLYPWADAFHAINPGLGVQAIVFVILLLSGLVYAWKKGAMEWV